MAVTHFPRYSNDIETQIFIFGNGQTLPQQNVLISGEIKITKLLITSSETIDHTLQFSINSTSPLFTILIPANSGNSKILPGIDLIQQIRSVLPMDENNDPYLLISQVTSLFYNFDVAPNTMTNLITIIIFYEAF